MVVGNRRQRYVTWDGDLLEGDGEGVSQHRLGEASSHEAAEELREHDFFNTERSRLQIRGIEAVNERCDHYPGTAKERTAMEEGGGRERWLPVAYIPTTSLGTVPRNVKYHVKKSLNNSTKVPQPVLRHLRAMGSVKVV